jgi:hypothetical protein
MQLSHTVIVFVILSLRYYIQKPVTGFEEEMQGLRHSLAGPHPELT